MINNILIIIVTRLLIIIISYGATTHCVLVDTVDHGEHAAVGGCESEHGGMRRDAIVRVCPSVSQSTVWVVVDNNKMVVGDEVGA